MGYLSDFEIKTEPPIPGISFSYVYPELVSDSSGKARESQIKWYEHEKDMVKISTDWPKVVFTVSIQGPEDGYWYCYYRNGLTYTWEPDTDAPPFDETKLKEPEL